MFIKIELKILLIILILMIALAFIYFSDPTGGPIFPCIFNKVTGHYCPGCGMTRSIHSILRFQPIQAFRYNALSLVIPFVLTIYYISKYKGMRLTSKYILVLMIIISISFGILRNIPKFAYLAPA
jgi:hypothetical protein